MWRELDIPSLDHELLDNAVESGALVAEALLASSKSTEVLSSLGDRLAVEADCDTAELLIAVGDVEVDLVTLACSTIAVYWGSFVANTIHYNCQLTYASTTKPTVSQQQQQHELITYLVGNLGSLGSLSSLGKEDKGDREDQEHRDDESLE